MLSTWTDLLICFIFIHVRELHPRWIAHQEQLDQGCRCQIYELEHSVLVHFILLHSATSVVLPLLAACETATMLTHLDSVIESLNLLSCGYDWILLAKIGVCL